MFSTPHHKEISVVVVDRRLSEWWSAMIRVVVVMVIGS